MESQTVQEKDPRLLPIVKLHGIPKRTILLIHFFLTVYLINSEGIYQLSPVRLERTTSGSGGQRSIQLSYGDTYQYHIYYAKTDCKSRI